MEIKLKRGLEATIPTLQEGEPGFTTDSKKLFVGSDAGNIEIGTQQAIDEVAIELAGKVDKVTGKGLSANDYTDNDKAKVDALIVDGDGSSYLSNDGKYKPVSSGYLPDEETITLNENNELEATNVSVWRFD